MIYQVFLGSLRPTKILQKSLWSLSGLDVNMLGKTNNYT